MSYKVKVNGEYIELYKSTVIAQTLKSNDFGDLTTRKLNFTNQIRIPRTKKNNEVFGRSWDERSSTTIPYEKLIVDIEIDGYTIVLGGVGVLINAGEDYTLVVYSGARGFFDAMGEKTMYDIVGLPFDNYWLDTTERNSLSDIRYHVVNDGDDTVRAKYFASYKRVIELIFENAGYSYSGNIFASEKFNWMSIGAFGGSIRGYSDRFIQERQVIANKDDQIISFPLGDYSEILSFPVIVQQSTNPTVFWDDVNSRYVMLEPLLANDPLKETKEFWVRVRLTLTMDTTFASGPVTFDVIVGNNEIENGFGYQTEPNNIRLGSFISSTDTSFIFDSFVSRTAETSNWMNNGLSNYLVVSVQKQAGLISGNIHITGGSIIIEPYGEYENTTNQDQHIYFNALLPEIKQKDLIKDFLIQNALLIDEREGNIQLKSINDIISDDDFVDWTSKRDMDVKDSLTFTPFDYAQQNIFKYKQGDESVGTLTGYGLIDLFNPNIPTEKTIYTSIFNAYNDTIVDGGKMASVLLFDGTDILPGNKFNIDPKPTLLLSRPNNESDPGIDYPDGTQTDYRTYYFADPEQPYQMAWKEFIDDNYSYFASALQQSKIITRWYNLNPSDISKFSFMFPVFDSGVLYLCNGIENYKNGSNTKVQLFKVSPLDFDSGEYWTWESGRILRWQSNEVVSL